MTMTDTALINGRGQTGLPNGLPRSALPGLSPEQTGPPPVGQTGLPVGLPSGPVSGQTGLPQSGGPDRLPVSPTGGDRSGTGPDRPVARGPARPQTARPRRAVNQPAEPEPKPSTFFDKVLNCLYWTGAVGAFIGQVWVAAVKIPFPESMPVWVRISIVAPFCGAIEAAAVGTSGKADERMRRDENAYGWRILSAIMFLLSISINVVGHIDTPYVAALFGGLSLLAYSVWLMHSADRRRDASAKQRITYSRQQRKAEPAATLLAVELAARHGYDRWGAIEAARDQIRQAAADEQERQQAAEAEENERRRLAELRQQAVDAITVMVRQDHPDHPELAQLRIATLDPEVMADRLMADQEDVDAYLTIFRQQVQPRWNGKPVRDLIPEDWRPAPRRTATATPDRLSPPDQSAGPARPGRAGTKTAPAKPSAQTGSALEFDPRWLTLYGPKIAAFKALHPDDWNSPDVLKRGADWFGKEVAEDGKVGGKEPARRLQACLRYLAQSTVG